MSFNQIVNYFSEMHTLQTIILNILATTDDYKSELGKYFELFRDIKNNKYKIKSILHLIESIASNHSHDNNFWAKIKDIIFLIKDGITNLLTNDEVFTIFKNNKKMILFLFQSNIIIPDHSIFVILTNQIYENFQNDYFFYKELNQFYNSNEKYKKCLNLQDNLLHDQKRQLGENDDDICHLIRNDLINEFISYSNKNNLSPDSEIIPSMYETNQFLIQNKANLIDYSSFFGSIKIFKYLLQTRAKLSYKSMLYAIHGNNYEIIHLIEENIIFESNDIEEKNNFIYYIESIKCHHTELAQYFSSKCSNDITAQSMKYYLAFYNFEFLQIPDQLGENLFYHFCVYDYFIPAKILIKNVNLSKEGLVLYESTKRGNVDIVKLLLENPQIDVNFKKFDKKEDCALIEAIKNEHYEIVKLLLDHPKININQKYKIKCGFGNQNDIPALTFAILNKNIKIAKLLIERKEIKINEETIFNVNFETEENKISLLVDAIRVNSIEIVQLLLNHPKIDVNKSEIIKKEQNVTSLTPLYKAIKNNQNEIAKLLINHKKININDFSFIIENNKSKKITALCAAIENQNIEIIKMLVSKSKIDVNKRVKWSENILNKYGILQRKIKNKKSPLLLAVETDNAEIVKILLNCSKINVNDKNISYCQINNKKKMLLLILFLLSMVILAIYSLLYDNKKLGALSKLGFALTILIH